MALVKPVGILLGSALQTTVPSLSFSIAEQLRDAQSELKTHLFGLSVFIGKVLTDLTDPGLIYVMSVRFKHVPVAGLRISFAPNVLHGLPLHTEHHPDWQSVSFKHGSPSGTSFLIKHFPNFVFPEQSYPIQEEQKFEEQLLWVTHVEPTGLSFFFKHTPRSVLSGQLDPTQEEQKFEAQSLEYIHSSSIPCV